jgi:ferredoxin
MEKRSRIVLRFPKDLVDKPIISSLVKKYNLNFNILKANITPSEEGIMVIELIGNFKEIKNGIEYLKKLGVTTQPLNQDIRRNEEKCIHCGLCVVFCPSKSFLIEKETQMIKFLKEKCIACEICIKICPPRAMEVNF